MPHEKDIMVGKESVHVKVTDTEGHVSSRLSNEFVYVSLI